MDTDPPSHPVDLDVASAAIALLDAALAETDMFWSQVNEEDSVYAEVLARDLRHDEWQALYARWRQRPVAWQRCLATVLAAVAPQQAAPWLLEMVEQGEDELALHAIDELRDMLRGRSLILPWPPTAVRRVKELWSRHRGFTASQLEQFLADLRHGSVVDR